MPNITRNYKRFGLKPVSFNEVLILPHGGVVQKIEHHQSLEVTVYCEEEGWFSPFIPVFTTYGHFNATVNFFNLKNYKIKRNSATKSSSVIYFLNQKQLVKIIDSIRSSGNKLTGTFISFCHFRHWQIVFRGISLIGVMGKMATKMGKLRTLIKTLNLTIHSLKVLSKSHTPTRSFWKLSHFRTGLKNVKTL